VEALNGIIEEVKANNLQIDLDNARLEKMKSKICITSKSTEGIVPNNEVALVKLNNYREEGQPSHIPSSHKQSTSPLKSDPSPAAPPKEGEKVETEPEEPAEV